MLVYNAAFPLRARHQVSLVWLGDIEHGFKDQGFTL